MLFVTLLISACATVEIPDFNAYVTLPASGDGFSVSTVSRQERRIPRQEWDLIRRKGIVLLSEDWIKLKYTILKSCLSMKCKQSVGSLDALFESLDKALKDVKL